MGDSGRQPAWHPRITIAVPSYNQGAFIRETLQSLVDQQYPNLEVIVQDAGSTDGAVEIAREFAARYPETFRVYVEKDRGHAHALNLAFARATGEIHGFLNTDDTLYPGCLHQVAREIDPARGRCVVFGRCLFTGEGSPYVGTEHPAEYAGHFDLLAVWKRGHNRIPQPSTFWHRRVAERCGGFDEGHNHGLDYLHWCKVSKHFWFHRVDALWSTYRMHAFSVSANKTEDEWLRIMVAYSRMHWGPWWSPLRWRCEVSYRLPSRRARRGGRFFGTMRPAMATLLDGAQRRAGEAEAAFEGRYSDNWIGPAYRSDVSVPAGASRLIVEVAHDSHRQLPRVSPALWLNGKLVDRKSMYTAGKALFLVDVRPYRGTSCTLEIRTPEFFIPGFANGGSDNRRLSLHLLDQRVEST